MNLRPLGPEPSALPSALHPDIIKFLCFLRTAVRYAPGCGFPKNTAALRFFPCIFRPLPSAYRSLLLPQAALTNAHHLRYTPILFNFIVFTNNCPLHFRYKILVSSENSIYYIIFLLNCQVFSSQKNEFKKKTFFSI